jgi:D-alanyl-D-alanine carboxypeptidase
MIRSVAFLTLSVLCAGCSGQEESLDASPRPASLDELTVELQRRLDDLHDREAVDDDGTLRFPGVSLAVRLPDGETVSIVTGHADREAMTPLSAGHRFASGSTGKVAAGALATRLIVEGKLDPDEKIERWFADEPWFADLPNHDMITVRHLLQHSSGLRSYYDNPEWSSVMRELSDPDRPGHDPDATLDFASLMSFVANQPALFPAGTESSYSENGYLLLGAALGKVLAEDDRAGEDAFREAYYAGLEELVLEPLGMEHTTRFVGREHPDLSQAYVADHFAMADGVDKVLDEDGIMVFSPTAEFSGGGLVTTPADLTRLVEGAVHGRVFEDPAAQEAFAELIRTPGPGEYGFGPAFGDSPLGPTVGHGGEFPGYRSIVFWVQDHEFTIAMQVNSWRPEEDDLLRWLAELAPVVVDYLEMTSATD